MGSINGIGTVEEIQGGNTTLSGTAILKEGARSRHQCWLAHPKKGSQKEMGREDLNFCQGEKKTGEVKATAMQEKKRGAKEKFWPKRAGARKERRRHRKKSWASRNLITKLGKKKGGESNNVKCVSPMARTVKSFSSSR